MKPKRSSMARSAYRCLALSLCAIALHHMCVPVSVLADAGGSESPSTIRSKPSTQFADRARALMNPRNMHSAGRREGMLELARSPEDIVRFVRERDQMHPISRMLPSSKGSITPSVNCVGSWGSWGACNASMGKQMRTYTITTARSGSGSDCPNSNGDTDSQNCDINCQGSWGSWGACNASTGKQTKTYSITAGKMNSGYGCSDSDCANVNDCTNGETKERNCDVDCEGTWGAWSSCDVNTGKEVRTYTVTTAAKNGGAACSTKSHHTIWHGATEQRTCKPDCEGEFSVFGGCSDYMAKSPAWGTRNRTYNITHPKAHPDGADCPHAQGYTETKECTIPTRTFSWDYAVDKDMWGDESNRTELMLLVCPLGSSITFQWTKGMHDIWKFTDERAYLYCNFSSATRRSEKSTGSYVFPCNTPGTHYFGCSKDRACPAGKQRVRVHVTQPSKTVALRSTGLVSSQAMVLEDDLIPVDYDGILTDSHAAEIIEKLKVIEQNSPGACSDWLPDWHNSNATCRSWAYTDLGFVYRSKSTPNYEKAKEYYEKALAVSPKLCLASAYLVELSIQQGDRSKADRDFAAACSACGHVHLDMVLVRSKYKKKGWALPPGTECSQYLNIVDESDTEACLGRNQTFELCRRIRGRWAWTCDNSPLKYNHCAKGELMDPSSGECKTECPSSGQNHHGK